MSKVNCEGNGEQKACLQATTCGKKIRGKKKTKKREGEESEKGN